MPSTDLHEEMAPILSNDSDSSNANTLDSDIDLILYQDEFCKISSKTGVTIFKYFMPLGTSKVIPWTDILECTMFDPTKHYHLIHYRFWGMGYISKIWLAFDKTRISFKPPHQCVIINTGRYIKKGFSCKDEKLAIQLIRKYARPTQNINKKKD